MSRARDAGKGGAQRLTCDDIFLFRQLPWSSAPSRTTRDTLCTRLREMNKVILDAIRIAET